MSKNRDLNHAVGILIRRERTKQFLTLRNLADATGINRYTLKRIEDGEQDISVRDLLIIARALERSPSHMLPEIH